MKKEILLIILILYPVWAEDICGVNFCLYGECEVFGAGYKCHCFKGAKGFNCSQLLYPSEDPCLQNPCWNNGKCIRSGNQWKCECLSSFYGSDCRERKETFCSKFNPCKNNGICMFEIQDSNASCICIDEFTGKYCETKISFCERKSVKCFNGGSCENDKCDCPINFIGEYCETFTLYGASPLNTIKIKNKGTFTAVVTLRYAYKEENIIERVNLNIGETIYLKYPIASTIKFIAIGAVTYTQTIFVKMITEQEACLDIIGTLIEPKSIEVQC